MQPFVAVSTLIAPLPVIIAAITRFAPCIAMSCCSPVRRPAAHALSMPIPLLTLAAMVACTMCVPVVARASCSSLCASLVSFLLPPSSFFLEPSSLGLALCIAFPLFFGLLLLVSEIRRHGIFRVQVVVVVFAFIAATSRIAGAHHLRGSIAARSYLLACLFTALCIGHLVVAHMVDAQSAPEQTEAIKIVHSKHGAALVLVEKKPKASSVSRLTSLMLLALLRREVRLLAIGPTGPAQPSLRNAW